jgi:hypothetical protein
LITKFLVNFLFHKNFTDIIGTNLVKTDILKTLECKYRGPAHTFYLISKLCKNNYKTGEVPVWYKPRTLKEGKTIRAWDIIPAVFTILKVKIFG